MILGTVRGNIVSTINHRFYDGKKMLVVEKEDLAGNPAATSMPSTAASMRALENACSSSMKAIPPARS